MAKRLELGVHMDGARLANALATLKVAPKEVTWKIGVDVLCLGGAKNGMAIGEAVVFFNRDRAAEFDYHCKQAGQLGSKMRFISAPWAAMIESGAYLRRAEHANRCADRLERGLRSIPGIGILFPRQANSVFVQLPPGMADALQARGWIFYTFIGVGGARLMCSWDTQDADIDALLADVRAIAAP
jgi:threonine aldolase